MSWAACMGNRRSALTSRSQCMTISHAPTSRPGPTPRPALCAPLTRIDLSSPRTQFRNRSRDPVSQGSFAGDERHDVMIDLLYWTTPNGHKVTIFLEETGLPYKIIPVNIGKGEQFKPDFLAVSPNNRIPAIVDRDPPGGGKPVSIFESGAILLYLAEKTGKFMPKDVHGRYDVIQWLFWQMGGLGPMAGQNHHFSVYAPEKIPYAIDRYVKETNRLYAVLNKRLADRPFLAGEYSIADMASYPWIVPYERQGQKLEDFPYLKRWFEAIRARPAVVRAYEKAKDVNPNMGGIRTAEERAILFGQTAASVDRAAAKAR